MNYDDWEDNLYITKNMVTVNDKKLQWMIESYSDWMMLNKHKWKRMMWMAVNDRMMVNGREWWWMVENDGKW